MMRSKTLKPFIKNEEMMVVINSKALGREIEANCFYHNYIVKINYEFTEWVSVAQSVSAFGC